VRVTDTVGFIRKLPHHLVASFRATLEEVREADLLLHVIDASHPAWEEQVEVVEGVLAEMGVHDGGGGDGAALPQRKRVVYVFNKADLLPDPDAFLARVRERYPHSVLTSAALDRPRPPSSVFDRPGVGELRQVLRTFAQALRPLAQVRVPLGDGRLLAELHREGEVTDQHQEDGVVLVTARVEARLLGRLRREGVGVEILG
jgi:GTP-binding protein HflX